MKKVNKHRGKLLGGYVPLSIVEAVGQWVEQHPERSRSLFIREASREKLQRDGIKFRETRNRGGR